MSHTATTFAPNPGRPGLTQPLLPTGPVPDAHTGLVQQVMGKLGQHAVIHFPEQTTSAGQKNAKSVLGMLTHTGPASYGAECPKYARHTRPR